MKRARNINLTVQISKRQDWIIRKGGGGGVKRQEFTRKGGGIEINTTIKEGKMSKILITQSAKIE